MTQLHDHEPPQRARFTLAVHRDPDAPSAPWGKVVERPLDESKAVVGTGKPPAKEREERCGGEQFARPSKRRVCMPYGAHEREERRDCPTLLTAFERYKAAAPAPTSRRQIEKLTRRVFEDIERIFVRDSETTHKADEYSPLPLDDLKEGYEALYKAFRSWVEDPLFLAYLRADPAERDTRRKQQGKPRAAFSSAAAVLSTAFGPERALGMGAASLGGAGGGGSGAATPKNLGAVERTIDASRGVESLALPAAEVQAIIEGAQKVSLEDRLLAFRAAVARWRCPQLSEKLVQKVGIEEAEREAMRAAAPEILKATAHLTDKQIRQAIGKVKEQVEEHLRKLPHEVKEALDGEGDASLVTEESIHGLIPARVDKPARRGGKRLMPSYFDPARRGAS